MAIPVRIRYSQAKMAPVTHEMPQIGPFIPSPGLNCRSTPVPRYLTNHVGHASERIFSMEASHVRDNDAAMNFSRLQKGESY